MTAASHAVASPNDPGCWANPQAVIGQFYAVRSISYVHVASQDTCYPRAVTTKIRYRVYFSVKDVAQGRVVMSLVSATRTVTVGYGVSPTNLDVAESSSFACVKGRPYVLSAEMWYDDGSGGILRSPVWTSNKVICTV